MKLAAMQPYFLPYLGQFDLLHQVDLWVVFDVAQYIRHGWVNRNRVLHPVAGWQYIIVPVQKHSYQVPINQIEVAGQEDWQTRIFRQLEHYHGTAPYYTDVIAFLGAHLDCEDGRLSSLNVRLFRAVSRWLGIETPIVVFSESGVSLDGAHGPENLALSLCKAFGAEDYLNPPGGRDLYNPAHFLEWGIQLEIQEYSPLIYPCGPYVFEPNLSILDVMMWNSPEQVKHYLDTLRFQSERKACHGHVVA